MFNIFSTPSSLTAPFISIPPVSLLPGPQSVLDDLLITESEVFQALSSLDPSKAMGCGGIGPRLLKHCALAVYQPFRHLFCLSLSQHYIPVEWRTHMVRPIFKSGDRNSVKNYRSISLLCVTSKVLERIVYNHIIDFVNNRISSVFCVIVLLCSSFSIFLNTINTSLNTNSQTDVAYLDFRKA